MLPPPPPLVGGLTESTVQDALLKLPEKVPSVQRRCCETQFCPYATDGAWYAVTLAPFATPAPMKLHDAAVPTEQEEY